MIKRFIQYTLILGSLYGTAAAQGANIPAVPEIGKTAPFFELKNIGNFPKKSVTSTSLKGRYVILDFWNKNCVSCVQSFPKLNQVHELYKDKLDLILVGTEEEGIKQMFQTFAVKQNLKFPFAYNYELYKGFVAGGGAPHTVWIDDKGIVQVISYGNELTKSNIEAFLSDKRFSFRDKSHAALAKRELNSYDYSTPFLIDANGGDEYKNNFKYRALITEFIPGTPKMGWPVNQLFRFPFGITQDSRVLFEGSESLEALYRFAFTGYLQWSNYDTIYKYVYPKIILEMEDSSLFRSADSGQYVYSLVAPKMHWSATYLMESMQNDLKRYFGYDARMESRIFSYLKIVATDKVEKLKTKGEKTSLKTDYIMYKGINCPLNSFFQSSLGKLNYWETLGKVPVIINETGIDYNVDIDVKINCTDWKDVQKVFKELGFEFVAAEKEFKVLVIRDRKP